MERVEQEIEVETPVQLNVTVPPANWTLFRELPTFDMRNGAASSVTSVLIKATIAESYHWVPIGALASQHATKAIDGYIRSHLVHLFQHKPLGMTDSQIRKAAIILGTVRATVTSFYRLTTADLIAGEVRPPVLNGVLMGESMVVYSAAPGYAGEEVNQLTQGLDISDVERAAICAIVKCAVGVIAMQGYSLMMTGHHYLSSAESQSRKVYAVVEKAYWKSSDVASWFNDDLLMIQDLLWHKSTHPVHIGIKTSSAMDPEIAVKVSNAGSGACASRLPAMESELRAANSYVTLFSTVAPMFKMFGGDVNIAALTNAIKFVQLLPPGVENPTIPQGLVFPPASGITNRYSALTYLGAMLKRNADSAAFCYGFYTALSDSNISLGGAGGTTVDTLKSSYSLTKLKMQSYASYVSGTQSYGDYQAVRNLRRQNGEFIAPILDVE